VAAQCSLPVLVHPSLGVTSVAELIAAVKDLPKQGCYDTPECGSRESHAMATNGTYDFVYLLPGYQTGTGLFSIADGELRGFDSAGGHYTGTVKDNADGSISFALTLHVPANMPPVQGTAAQEVPHERQMSGTFPSDFGNGKAFEINSPPGTVWVEIKRVPYEEAQLWFNNLTKGGIRRSA
jgi:hypothetical protein